MTKKPYTPESLQRALDHHVSTGALASAQQDLSAKRPTWIVYYESARESLRLDAAATYALCIGLARGERTGRRQPTEWMSTLGTAISYRPAAITGPFGTHGVTYERDEDDEPYASIGFNLPEGVYAEIEDGTYGELQALRVYLGRSDS